MNLDSPARPSQAPAPIGSDELAEGLMLVRASTLKMIRLQLAIQRNDRRVALEAVDDLVSLDRRLRDYLSAVPGSDRQVMFRRELDAERAMLDREKLTLAAEVLRRAPEPQIEQPEPIGDDWLGPRGLPIEDAAPRRSRLWLAGIPVAASALTAAAWFAGVPEIRSWLAAAMEVLR
jgi:hypothetical protein